MAVFVVIAVMSVIQSLFGIGLLVFGTPTLLLMGYSFSETLAVLLPASLMVSVLQIVTAGLVDNAFARKFGAWCVIPMVVALGGALLSGLHVSFNALVAVLLFIFAVVRLMPTTGDRAKKWITENERSWLVLMGVVHGLSNLGGGLLTVLAGAKYENKADIRKLVAFCYAFMAISQIIVLALFQPQLFGLSQFAYAATSGLVFLLVGRHVFVAVNPALFSHLLTLFMASYAVLLGLKTVGVL